MSRGNGSSVIPFAVFCAILLIVLPAGADNVTVSETTVVPTTNITTQATVTVTNTTVPSTQTTVATTQTAVTTTRTSATPTATTVTTQPVTVVTTTIPTTIRETITTGSVNVYSSPTGASILIDGTYCGTTPKTVNGVPAGNHILRLTLSGYNDYEGSIYIVAGQMAQGYGTLQPISQVVSAAPTQTVIVPVVVPVAVTPEPTQDPGLLGNSSVIVAIIGVITAIIAAGASVFTHVKPPKKE